MKASILLEIASLDEKIFSRAKDMDGLMQTSTTASANTFLKIEKYVMDITFSYHILGLL